MATSRFRVDIIETKDAKPVTLTGHATVKAWTSFDQVTALVINSSFGVSSMTDVGTGIASAAFTTPFLNDYACAYSQYASAFWGTYDLGPGLSMLSCEARSFNYSGTAQDLTVCSFSYIGNLA